MSDLKFTREVVQELRRDLAQSGNFEDGLEFVCFHPFYTRQVLLAALHEIQTLQNRLDECRQWQGHPEMVAKIVDDTLEGAGL